MKKRKKIKRKEEKEQLPLVKDIIAWGSGFLLPLFFLPGISNPFLSPKILVASLTLLIATGVLLSKNTKESTKLSIGFRMPLFLFPLYLLFATNPFLSFAPLNSFLGSFVRFNGIISWILYTAFFYFGYNLTQKEAKQHFLKALSLTILILFVIALFQTQGFDFVPRKKSLSLFSLNRVSGTFETPSHLGSYLALVLPFFIYYTLKTKKLSLIGISFLGLTLMFLTFSRGAWIGLLSFFLMMALLKIKSTRGRVIYLFISLLILTTLAYFLTFSLGRERTVIKRIEFWKVCLNLINQRPLTGYGADNLSTSFPYGITKNYERQIKLITKSPKRPTIIDRAHNIFFDLGVDFGVPLLTFLLWPLIYGFLALIIFRDENSLNDEKLTAKTAYFLGAFSYFVSLLAHFLNPDVAPLFFYFLGASITKKPYSLENLSNSTKKRRGSPYEKMFLVFAIFLSIFFSFQIISSYYFAKAFQANSEGNFQSALENISKSQKFTFWSAELDLIEGKLLLGLGVKTQSQRLVNAAIKSFKDATKKSPLDERGWLELGSAHLAKFNLTKDPGFLLSAEKYLLKVEEIDPNNSELKLKKGLLFYYGKNIDRAIEEWEKGLFLAPNNQLLIKNLALAYQLKGEKVKYAQMMKLLKKIKKK